MLMVGRSVLYVWHALFRRLIYFRFFEMLSACVIYCAKCMDTIISWVSESSYFTYITRPEYFAVRYIVRNVWILLFLGLVGGVISTNIHTLQV